MRTRDVFSSDWDDRYQVQWVESIGIDLVRGCRDAARRHHRRGRSGLIDELWHALPAFPTVSETWLRLLEADHGI